MNIILKGSDYTELNEYIKSNFTQTEFDTIEPKDKDFKHMLRSYSIILKYCNGLLDIRGRGKYRDLVHYLKSIPYMKDLFVKATKDDYFKHKYEEKEFDESLDF